MSDKPLHVRVAEALGWSHLEQRGGLPVHPPIEIWAGYPPEHQLVGVKEPVPHYDTNPAATWPLIVKYGIQVGPMMWCTTADFETRCGEDWIATSARADEPVYASDPLIAVCNLILKLAEEKKLNG